MYTGGYEHLIVLDDYSHVIGVLSVKDIGRSLVLSFESAGDIEHFSLKNFLETPVADIHSKPVIGVEEDPGLAKALRIMYERGIGILPVITREGLLVTAYTELHAAFLLLSSNDDAKTYASFDIVWGEPDSPLIEAIGFMHERGFRRLPFIHEDTVLIATLSRILHYLASIGDSRALLHPLEAVSVKATVVDEKHASLGLMAELILSLTERCVLIKSMNSYGILTVRDLLRAAVDKGVV